jgi:drug/metabolite transporter (DMT)-like permease
MVGGSPGGRARAEAYLALGILALSWGYSWVMVKVATQHASPLAVALSRNVVGAVALFGFLALTRRSLRPPPFLPTLVYGLLQTSAFHLAQSVAVSLAGAGRVAILAYTMPFWLVLLARPFLGERIRGGQWLALALAGAGLALIVTPIEARSVGASALAIGSGLIWAASAVWVIRLRRAGSHDPLSLTAWQMVWGSLPLAALALFVPLHVHWTAAFVGAIGFLGVVANAVGWALWLFILGRLPAGVAGVASLATPVVGVVAAALQLGEVPSRRELGGIACIVVALVVNARAGAAPRPAAPPDGRGVARP